MCVAGGGGRQEETVWPRTPYVYQIGLELRDTPAPASQLLRLRACIIISDPEGVFFKI